MNLITQQRDDVIIVKLPVDHLDTANSNTFKTAVNEQLDPERRIVLDLSNVRFVDSSGLGAFLSSLRKINNSGGQLKMSNLTTAVKALFELVRMNKVFEIYDDVDAAMASFN